MGVVPDQALRNEALTIAGAPIQDEGKPLIELLRELPPVLQFDAPIKVPRRARKRIGRIMRQMLAAVMRTLPSGGAPVGPECWEATLLLKHAYALLTWRPRGQAGDGPDKETRQRTQLRMRFQLAEAIKWRELVSALLTAGVEGDAERDEWALRGTEEESAEEQRWRQRGAAIRKVNLDCTRTAAQMLRGQQGLPPCEATAAAQKQQLVTEAPSEEEEASFKAAVEQALVVYHGTGGGPGARLLVQESSVRRRLVALRMGAQPGGAGCRNDVLKAMSEVKGGVATLQQWAQLWADARIPPCLAAEWVGQVLRPIRKENGKPRNISLMEVLFKFASGVVQDAVRNKPGQQRSGGVSAEGLHWSQYGGVPAGPETMLMVHQGLMRLRPNLAYCSLDAANAYGTIKRSAMLAATAKWCPEHAGFLAVQWRAPARVWLERSPGKWEREITTEGTAQGDTASTPAFSRGMRLALESACERLLAEGIWIHLPSLVDDILLVTEQWSVDRAIEVVEQELSSIGLKLNLDKCACYVPARSEPSEAITAIPQVFGGLPALGSAYAGEYETRIGQDSVAAAPARKRLAAAKTLAQECAKFRREGRDAATLQASWHALGRVAAKALVYDVRTLRAEASIPIAAELDEAVADAARAILDVRPADGWTDTTTAQLHWPTELGGFGFGSATLSARLGRVAAVAQCLPTARVHLRRILPEASEDEIRAAVPLAGVKESLDWLKNKYGIELSVNGNLASAKEPRWDPAADFQPLRGVCGLLTRAIQTKDHDAVVAAHAAGSRTRPTSAEQEAHTRHACRLRSSAGVGVHEWTTECPSDSNLRLNDTEFEYAARWRLGLPVMPAGDCKHRAAKDPDGAVCGKQRDRFGDHAVLCGKGAGRYRVHNALSRRVARIARSCGVEAEPEEVCPALLKGEAGKPDSTEARLDVHLWSPGPEPFEEWVDVTVVHPFQVKRKAAATGNDGVAVEAAEQSKRERYGLGVGGVACAPMGFESWGRIGCSAQGVLDRLAVQHARLHSAPCARTLRRWRAELGVAMYRAMAETAAAACRCTRNASQEGTQGALAEGCENDSWD